MQTEKLLYWNGMTDTEHTTCGSSEEEQVICFQKSTKISAMI